MRIKHTVDENRTDKNPTDARMGGPMSFYNSPKGQDLLWLASDASGRLAAFFTAGEGLVPKSLLAEEIDICTVEDELSSLPLIAAPKLLVSVPRPDDFIALAQRGLWVYDWQDVHRSSSQATHRYELVAMPLSPISVSDLPVRLGRFVELVRLRGIYFEDHASLDMHSLVECVST